jgi:hypothetical protein
VSTILELQTLEDKNSTFLQNVAVNVLCDAASQLRRMNPKHDIFEGLTSAFTCRENCLAIKPYSPTTV